LFLHLYSFLLFQYFRHGVLALLFVSPDKDNQLSLLKPVRYFSREVQEKQSYAGMRYYNPLAESNKAKSVTWSSNNTGVATVSNTGMLTTKTQDTATVTVTAIVIEAETGMEHIVTATARVSSEGGGIVIQGLAPGREFAVYTVKGEKYAAGTADSSGEYRLVDVPEGLYKVPRTSCLPAGYRWRVTDYATFRLKFKFSITFILFNYFKLLFINPKN
jgi:hypothetical protein